jgi:hypothetical protein
MNEEKKVWYVIGVVFNGQRQFQIAIFCPFCADVHIHGEEWGPRAAHCGNTLDHPNYILTPAPSDGIDSVLREKIAKKMRGRGFDFERPKTMPAWEEKW